MFLSERTIGTITDEKGFFNLTVNKNDTIKFSHIAYRARVMAVNQIKSDTIILRERYKNIEGIVVKGSKFFHEKSKIGFFNKDHRGEFSLGPGNQISVFIDNPKKKAGWIKTINFEVKKMGKCSSTLRIRLLENSNNSMTPGRDLLTENYIIENTKLVKHNTVDISKSMVYLPPEGIFVVIEWVSLEPNCEKESYPTLDANLDIKEDLVWVNFRDKKWSKTPERARVFNGNFMTPNIYLSVSF